MIEYLLKTYELFPKQPNETERQVQVSVHSMGYEIRLILWINDRRYTAVTSLSELEYENLKNTDISDALIRRVCRKCSDDFGV